MAYNRFGRIGLTGRLILVRGGRVDGAFADLNKILRNTGVQAQVSGNAV